ncbi:lysylphosphatidylglycerol synthase transmembrane domain-containing protein [Micromonospora okii]|uniref:lysylphosphatidylglycerol synthase transmembrane domain-containing protein n=1 Tax=Micromonospora okii TaxID=1182970 RepID=UPI001E59B838|nr:lysylphosphatidylglycerol synthase transmembrane domain-containing protein [Micromonospora okii]
MRRSPPPSAPRPPAGSPPTHEPGVAVAVAASDPPGALPGPSGETARSGSWRTRRLRLLAVAASVVALAAIGLRGRLPDPGEFATALADARYGWVALAALLQTASIAAFAAQQQHLVAAFGVRVRRRRLMAITLARTAISISVPAGAAVSTGYAIREYERAGAPREIGAVCAIVSGLASIGGLALMYVGGGAVLLTYSSTVSLTWRPLVVVAALVALTGAAVALGRRLTDEPTEAAPATHRGPLARWLRGLLASARDAWRAGASLRARDWWVVVGYATANWLTDLFCLAACARALGLPVDLFTLAGIYLGVQIVRQVPLTPGGIGVIETALVAGLTAWGATAISATAAVLVYRLLSCWLLIPAGGVAALVLRRPGSARTIPRPAPAARH